MARRPPTKPAKQSSPSDEASAAPLGSDKAAIAPGRSGNRVTMKTSVPDKLQTSATKKRPSSSSKGAWILPEDGLHKAFENIPLEKLLEMFPPEKKTSTTTE